MPLPNPTTDPPAATTQWTPGPWHVNPAEDIGHVEPRPTVWCGTPGNNDPDDDNCMGRVADCYYLPNARLIAAAPRMAAALRAALACYSDLSTDDFGLGRDKAVREQMRAALIAIDSGEG